MLRNGASLLQIYSSLVIEGPGLTKSMNKDIAKYLSEMDIKRKRYYWFRRINFK